MWKKLFGTPTVQSTVDFTALARKALADASITLTQIEQQALAANLSAFGRSFGGKWLDPEVVSAVGTQIAFRSLSMAGRVFLAQDDDDLAAESYGKAVRLIHWPTAMFGAGLAYASLGQNAVAVELLAGVAPAVASRGALLTRRFGQKAVVLQPGFDDLDGFGAKTMDELAAQATSMASTLRQMSDMLR